MKPHRQAKGRYLVASEASVRAAEGCLSSPKRRTHDNGVVSVARRRRGFLLVFPPWIARTALLEQLLFLSFIFSIDQAGGGRTKAEEVKSTPRRVAHRLLVLLLHRYCEDSCTSLAFSGLGCARYCEESCTSLAILWTRMCFTIPRSHVYYSLPFSLALSPLGCPLACILLPSRSSRQTTSRRTTAENWRTTLST